ncbi:hypothetical protein N7462_003335 [Penicillium macrosclerotiorum]|uniref:uncharacterized protein n=1 Tax=Penicillium macrosclerotiorum TaxID=303699 RepID=UPI0025488B57|nr:uncharacterized protein N7462_003335 [Penicillium macrosclerotiorum]KAJ5688943.1 hypothetical protein N7462_003335 [Penicillium macrosclerotiorum]
MSHKMRSVPDFHPESFPVALPPFNGDQSSAKDRINLVIDNCNNSLGDGRFTKALTLAWGIVLVHYTSSNDVLFGIARPPYSGLQPCALRLRPEDSITAAFDQVQDSITATYDAVQDTGTLKNILQIVEDGEQPFEELDSTCPLQIHVRIRPNAIEIHALFDGKVLETELMKMILFQLRHVYTSITKMSQASLGDIQGNSIEGIEKILQWNAQAIPQRDERLAHHIIEQRCREQPSAPAICAWDGTLTYGQLDQQATNMAARLVAAGVGPNRFVGLLMEKSMWTTVAIYAILKAGGCFYLMDASHPVQRLVLMIHKTQARLILASSKHEALAKKLELPTWIVPRDFEEEKLPPAQPQQFATVPADSMMYAGFTSGSTGEPKGFVMNHAAFSSGLETYCQQSSLSTQSRVLQYASYAFIVSLIDQIAPLTRGSCICVPSEQMLQDDLLGAIREHNANWAKLTPSVLRLLDPADLSGVKTLAIVGETIPVNELERWQHRGIQLLSLYGQSENSKCCSFADRNEPGCDVRQYNRPHCAIPWVVNPHNPDILMPIGAEGELLLEGPCVSDGYLDNPEQNRMTFIHAPAWLKSIRPDSHTRLLKTGDLVKYNPNDGTLYLVGRKGTQVKIRGQRIELAEIEHHLCPLFNTKDPAVVDVIIPSDDTSQNPLLVAFVPVGDQQSMLKRDGLVENLFACPTPAFRQEARKALSTLHEALPSYLTPQAIVAIAALPQTATGKLNRRMLREAASSLSRKDLLAYTTHDVVHQDPVTPLEIVLQETCSRVLNLPSRTIGMQSNFFDLGGNSITARELVTKCRQRGLYITVADLFRSSSLLTLARCHKDNDVSVPVEASDPFKSIRDKFLANLPATLIADQIEDAFPTLEEQHILASTHMLDYHIYELKGPVDISQLRRACQALVDKHTILRSIFVPFQEEIMQVILHHVNVPFSIECPQDMTADMWTKSFCEAELKKTYCADEPRVEFKLVQGSQDDTILIIRLLHAQYDAVGLQKMVLDLWSGYQDQAIHIESDFAAYARECVRQRTPEAYQFWRGLLENAQVTPAPFSNIPVAREENVCFEREMPLPTPPAGRTMATVVKVAWATVLQEWTGCSDVVFGQLIAARNLLLPGVDEILGPCINTIPVRVHQTLESAGPHDLLQDVQSEHAEGISFETIGWDEMVQGCTMWPRGTKPGSVIAFQNFNRSPQTQFGPVSCRKSTQFFNLPPEDTVWLLVYPSSTTACFALEASNAVLRQDEADALLKRFCEVLEEICNSSQRP